jgi:hypothetical protein
MNVKELTVEKLIVKDPAGKGTVEITGTEINMFDDRRVLRLAIRLEGDGYCPDVSLRDANWTERLHLNVNPHGGANISLKRENDRSAVWITTECGTCINLLDDGGKSRLDCYLDEDGDSIIALEDDCGKTRAQLIQSGQDDAALVFYDASEKPTSEVPSKGEKKEAHEDTEVLYPHPLFTRDPGGRYYYVIKKEG